MTPTRPARRRTPSFKLLGRMWSSYISKYPRLLALGVFCMIVVAATNAAMTRIVKPLVDDVFIAQDQEKLLLVVLATLAIFFIMAAATYGQHYLVSAVGIHVAGDVQNDLYGRLIRSDLKYFHTDSVGQSMSRFLTDAQLMRDAMAVTLVAIVKDVLTAAFLIALMISEDWQLSLLSAVVLSTVIPPMLRIGRLSRKSSENIQLASGSLAAFLSDTLSSIRQVKAYGQEDYESVRARQAIGHWLRMYLKNLRARSLIGPITVVIAGISVAIVVWFGGQRVVSGEITAGAFVAFLTAMFLLLQPIRRIGKLNAAFESGLAAVDRLFRAMDGLPEIEDRSGGCRLEVREGHVRFDNVTFAYPDGTPALTDVSLECRPGEQIALVGGSGGGKSTVLNLIARFYDADGGAITVDGQRVDEVSVESLRRAIGFVGQETALFDDTVRANIAYGQPFATDEEIEAAAWAANADGFIRALPDGYMTVVGSAGFRLSGGQRQRIAIARAVLRNAPILLLDEATSALDTESERKVQAALNELARGRSTVMVAHRLSTVINADRIYVIEGGHVVESGSHAELVKRRGRYAELYTDGGDIPLAAGAE